MTRDIFRSYCTSKMNELLNAATSLKWSAEHSIYKTSQVDLWGEGQSTLCLVELELRREDPVNNVIKVWRASEEGLIDYQQRKILFVHVFSEYYKSHTSKKENAIFAGKKMAEALGNFQYIPMDFFLNPPIASKTFPTETDDQIQNLCDEIANCVA